MTKASHTGSAAFTGGNARVALLPLPMNNTTFEPLWEDTKALFTAVSAMVRDRRILAASVVREGGAPRRYAVWRSATPSVFSLLPV